MGASGFMCTGGRGLAAEGEATHVAAVAAAAGTRAAAARTKTRTVTKMPMQARQHSFLHSAGPSSSCTHSSMSC